MKKVSFILAAAVVFAVGSAFTTAKSNAPKVDENGFADYSFVRVSGPDRSTNAADYEYRGTSSGDCEFNPDVTCKANWSQTTAPALNSHPTGSFVEVIQDGEIQ